MTNTTSSERHFLTKREVAAYFKVSTDSIRRWIRRGDFPKPLRIGTGTSRWLRTDIAACEVSLKPAYFATRLEVTSEITRAFEQRAA